GRAAIAPRHSGDAVETRWGGAFYLINVGLRLGLYGDFTTPARPGLKLPIWDFIALLAAGLDGAEAAADPLWPLLAALAGRNETQTAAFVFEPPADWRLPSEWLTAFPER